METTGVAIGIDLGTTNSCAAVVLNAQGAAEVLVNREGGRTTPSVFAVTEDGERIVGKPAVDQEAENADNTVRSVKRFMGTSERLKVGGKELSPEEISAEILKKIKADCEMALGKPVTAAVITIPAYFDQNQRQATKVAGELAGLEVLRVIAEPTAAALAYGLNDRRNQTVLVYDLGGGTFDVTVLKISDIGVFQVISTAGDTKLGGDDFDNALMDLIFAAAPHGIELRRPDRLYTCLHYDGIVDLDATAMARVREAAEQVKKELSAANKATVNLPYLAFNNGKPINIKTVITRQDFEFAIMPLVERTRVCVERALADANLKASDIHEVVFVGGSTRVPLIAEKVKAWTGKEPNRTVNPDEAVALGAAVQASILAGVRDRDTLILDVTPLTLGIETLGGVFNPMIKRNHQIPCDYTEEFTTSEDNQTKVEIKVYQGERPRCVDNRFLGHFHLEGIEPVARGQAKIEVKFEIDANGIIAVSASDKITGKAHTVTLTGTSSITSEDVQRILEDAETHAEEDRIFQEGAKLKEGLQSRMLQVDGLLRESRAVLDEELIAELEDLNESFVSAIDGPNNIDFLESLTQSAQETIKRANDLVREAAGREVGGADPS